MISQINITSCLIILNIIVALALIGSFLLKPAARDYADAWNELEKDSANNHDDKSPASNFWTISDGNAEDIKKIALTFDDGPHPFYTEEILDILKEKHIKATFFIMGQNAEKYPEIVKRIADEGHLIGNHTFTHLQLNGKNFDKFENELNVTKELLENITGKTVEFVRPPYGSWNDRFEKKAGFFPVLWTIDTLDWCTNDAQKVVSRIMQQPKDNDIILMHDGYKSTVTATEIVIDKLTEIGFAFVTAEEILMD